ncbi:helix-turn-helix domain-containing protein [Candidatus Omnitrophota bacterium]
MAETDNLFGKNLLYILKTKGINQSELAQKIGVSQSCLSRWINGRRALHASQRRKICDVLGISETSFFRSLKDTEKEETNLGPLF